MNKKALNTLNKELKENNLPILDIVNPRDCKPQKYG